MATATYIKLPWNFRSEVQHCTTCEGSGRVASQARPSVWNPYPETECNDCGGREGCAPCEVCGSEVHVPGYDCFVCQCVDELPRDALADSEALLQAIKTAIETRLLSLTDRRIAA